MDIETQRSFALMDKHLGGRIAAAGLIDDIWPLLGIANDFESLRKAFA